jgi:hypothetical protein
LTGHMASLPMVLKETASHGLPATGGGCSCGLKIAGNYR